MKKIAVLAVLLLVPLSAGSIAPGPADWPSWRGASGLGIGAGTPPIEWSEDRNVRWKTPLPGLGSATPIIWENRIYVLTAIGGEPGPDARPSWRGGAPPTAAVDWVVLAYDTETGAEVWSIEFVESLAQAAAERLEGDAPRLAGDRAHGDRRVGRPESRGSDARNRHVE